MNVELTKLSCSIQNEKAKKILVRTGKPKSIIVKMITIFIKIEKFTYLECTIKIAYRMYIRKIRKRKSCL